MENPKLSASSRRRWAEYGEGQLGFPKDRLPEVSDETVVQIRLKELELKWPRQWGACWLACHLYEQLGLDGFGAGRLPASRKGTRWDLILKVLTCYRLIDPGSKWRLHRQWTVILSRYTQPERELQLPSQPPPKITASGQVAK